MNDPTYDKELIDRDPKTKLAFELSEIHNDTAPMGWSSYIYLASRLLSGNVEALNSPVTNSDELYKRIEAIKPHRDFDYLISKRDDTIIVEIS